MATRAWGPDHADPDHHPDGIVHQFCLVCGTPAPQADGCTGQPVILCDPCRDRAALNRRPRA